MNENQGKVVEIGNAPDQPVKPKAEWEKIMEEMMRRAYLNGLSIGMKTMCGSVLEKMNQLQSQRMNPQQQLIHIRQWCDKCLSKVNEPPKPETAEVDTETENKEGENN